MALFNYECDEVKRIIEEVNPNYPQLTTYEKEWVFFHKYHYIPGIPVDLEYQEVIVNPMGTVQNAIPYSYKRAILKGNTLVNLINVKNATGGIDYTTKDLNLAYELPAGNYILFYDIIKANTSSGLGNPDRHTPIVTFNDGSKIYHGFEGFNTSTGKNYWIINATIPIVKVEYWLSNLVEDGEVDNLRLFAYQNGMENWDIPYFTGMQSVKMPVLTTTGKNLFDKTKFLRGYYVNESTGTLMGNGNNALYSLTDFIEIQPNKTLINNNKQTNTRYAFYDKNKTFINGGNGGQITSPSNAKYLRWSFAIDSEESYQIEYGSVRSSYEPFKSNILTINEDVELSGIDDVKDELDLLTGELVQKTEKIIFDGSEAWEIISSLEKDNTIFAQCYKYTRNNTNAISNILDYRSSLDGLDERGFRFNHFFQIRLNKNEISNITNNGVKEWVSKNNIIVMRVGEQTVKTVALTKLPKPYEGTNHYHLTANIPCEAILEVPVVSTGEQTLQEINNY